MVYPVYTVRDVKVGYDTQFLVQINEAAARRGFEMAISNPGTMMGFRPSDFELVCIGTFDTDTGCFAGLARPEYICGGADFAKS